MSKLKNTLRKRYTLYASYALIIHGVRTKIYTFRIFFKKNEWLKSKTTYSFIRLVIILVKQDFVGVHITTLLRKNEITTTRNFSHIMKDFQTYCLLNLYFPISFVGCVLLIQHLLLHFVP